MKKTDLPPELAALYEETPVLTEKEQAELGDAIKALNSDPKYIADEVKEHFLNTILAEMRTQGLNQNQLAEKWGKHRQYVSQILNPDKLKNFTIDTIVGLSMALGLRLDSLHFKPMEEAVVSDFFIEVDLHCSAKEQGPFVATQKSPSKTNWDKIDLSLLAA